nr:hypothetical protein [Tanacetum cinerariifolium]
MVARRLKEDVVRVTRRSDRIIEISVVIDGEFVNVINAYAPQVGLSNADKKRGSRSALVLEIGMKKGRSPQSMQGLQGLPRRDMLIATLIGNRRCTLREEATWEGGDMEAKDFMEEPEGGELLACRDGIQEDNDLAKEMYKAAKREAKIVVAWAKDEAYEDLYKKLDSKEGANDIYKIAKARERKRRDIGNVRYIKDEGEVKDALQRMGRNKAIGPDQIPIEAWTYLEDEGVKWLTCLFNKIFLSAKMPDEWRLSEVIPIYKNKGDAQACSNYRGIKLLNHTMNLWGRVIKIRLRKETRVSENQFGFIPVRSTTEAIHLLRSLMEKYRERQRDLHMAFLDLEKAYDSVPRELVWRTLRDKETPRRYSRVIKDIYVGVKTRVPTIGIQESIHWCMIFANDIMLIPESAEGLNNKIERLRKALEDIGLRVSREEMKYLSCDFGRYGVAYQEVDICIGDRILQPNVSFRYLGLMIHRSVRIDEDVAYRIGVAQANRVEVVELRMLRWTYGKTIVDMIPNGVFRAELDVDSIIDKMRKGRLSWFGYVRRRPQFAPVKRVEAMLVEGSRRRGRPKLR